MANGPEPKDRGTPIQPNPLNEELEAFKVRLDPKPHQDIVLPGFLFNDGKDRKGSFSPRTIWVMRRFDLSRLYDHTYEHYYEHDYEQPGWAYFLQHQELIELLGNDYREAIRERERIVDRIKPRELLGRIQRVWEGGNIVDTEHGSALTYPYLYVKEEIVSYKCTVSRDYYDYGNGPSYEATEWRTGKSGKWVADTVKVQVRAEVTFGDPPKKDEFAALLESPTFNAKVLPFPSEIWRRVDNLGIYVAGLTFPRDSSYVDIIDKLDETLEEQRVSGQLPNQRKALELAKIEELRKRGLFVKYSFWKELDKYPELKPFYLNI